MTIFEEILAHNIEYYHHESDLYFPQNEYTKILVAKFCADHPYFEITLFWDKDGNPWYDAPFAYDPFWSDEK